MAGAAAAAAVAVSTCSSAGLAVLILVHVPGHDKLAHGFRMSSQNSPVPQGLPMGYVHGSPMVRTATAVAGSAAGAAGRAVASPARSVRVRNFMMVGLFCWLEGVVYLV